jgi:hypothetical protein
MPAPQSTCSSKTKSTVLLSTERQQSASRKSISNTFVEQQRSICTFDLQKSSLPYAVPITTLRETQRGGHETEVEHGFTNAVLLAIGVAMFVGRFG